MDKSKKNKDVLPLDDEDLDSSEDDDYVPEAAKMKLADKELSKQNGTKIPDNDDLKTGIQILKEKRKQKETDDLWDLMNMEDDLTSKFKSKQQKIQEVPEVTVKSNTIEVENVLKEKKEDPLAELEDQKTEKKEEDSTFDQALLAIKRMKGKLGKQ
jgi:hypothetical protein